MSIWCKIGFHDWEKIKSSRVNTQDPMNASYCQYHGGGSCRCFIYDKICMRARCGANKLLATEFKSKWAHEETIKIDEERAKKERGELAEEKAELRRVYFNG